MQTISFRKCRSKVYRCIYQSKDLGDTRACCKLRVPHVPREKCVCVCNRQGKVCWIEPWIDQLVSSWWFIWIPTLGFITIFQLFTTILGEFWTLYDDFPAPFTANLSESITRSFDPRFVVMEKFCWEGSIFESNVQFHDGNLQDYNLFLYLYSDLGQGTIYLHLPYELYILIDLIDVLSLTQQSRHCI